MQSKPQTLQEQNVDLFCAGPVTSTFPVHLNQREEKTIIGKIGLSFKLLSAKMLEMWHVFLSPFDGNCADSAATR